MVCLMIHLEFDDVLVATTVVIFWTYVVFLWIFILGFFFDFNVEHFSDFINIH